MASSSPMAMEGAVLALLHWPSAEVLLLQLGTWLGLLLRSMLSFAIYSAMVLCLHLFLFF